MPQSENFASISPHSLLLLLLLLFNLLLLILLHPPPRALHDSACQSKLALPWRNPRVTFDSLHPSPRLLRTVQPFGNTQLCLFAVWLGRFCVFHVPHINYRLEFSPTSKLCVCECVWERVWVWVSVCECVCVLLPALGLGNTATGLSERTAVSTTEWIWIKWILWMN